MKLIDQKDPIILFYDWYSSIRNISEENMKITLFCNEQNLPRMGPNNIHLNIFKENEYDKIPLIRFDLYGGLLDYTYHIYHLFDFIADRDESDIATEQFGFPNISVDFRKTLEVISYIFENDLKDYKITIEGNMNDGQISLAQNALGLNGGSGIIIWQAFENEKQRDISNKMLVQALISIELLFSIYRIKFGLEAFVEVKDLNEAYRNFIKLQPTFWHDRNKI